MIVKSKSGNFMVVYQIGDKFSDFQREVITVALEHAAENILDVSLGLGLSRQTIRNWRRKYAVDLSELASARAAEEIIV